MRHFATQSWQLALSGLNQTCVFDPVRSGEQLLLELSVSVLLFTH